MTDADKKILGLWERIKPILAHDGFVALQEYLQGELLEAKTVAAELLDKALVNDTPENRNDYGKRRVDVLALQNSLNAHEVLRDRVRAIEEQIVFEKSLEGQETPGH